MEAVLELNNFPREILIEILIRLPIKTIVQFTLVSKSCYALITSPSFISTHLTKIRKESTKSHGLLLFRHYTENDKKEHYTLHPDNDDFVLKSSKIKFPFKSEVGLYGIVGSFDGLVCLCDDRFNTEVIILWNPSIQKFIELPFPSMNPYWYDLEKKVLLGFGCDSQRYDYKVVRIVYYQGTSLDFLPAVAEVYSLRAKRWRRIATHDSKYYMSEYRSSQVFVNGVVHWFAYGKGFGNLILGFDMKDEVFGEILLPDALAGERNLNLYPTIYAGCLAVMKYDEYRGSCSLWILNEYGNVESWKRLYNTELVEGMGKVIAFRKNGHFFATMVVDELFVNDPASGKLVAFDPENRLIKDLEICGGVHSFYIENFIESLVLLEGQSAF